MREIDKLENMLWGCMRTLETIKAEMDDYLGHELLADETLITGRQARGGRHMVLMIADDVSRISDVGPADLSKFEKHGRGMSKEGVVRVRKTLESKGVIFYADGSVGTK